MGYSMDPISANCYSGTTVLINKLDIRDEETLHEAETLVTFINASKLEQHPLEGAFDFEHYKAFTIFSSLICTTGLVRFGRWISARREHGLRLRRILSVRRS